VSEKEKEKVRSQGPVDGTQDYFECVRTGGESLYQDNNLPGGEGQETRLTEVKEGKEVNM